jgi:hypothetical protein
MSISRTRDAGRAAANIAKLPELPGKAAVLEMATNKMGLIALEASRSSHQRSSAFWR